MFVVEIIYNLAILVAISVLANYINSRWPSSSKWGVILQGVLFGGTTIIGMMQPFVFAQGIIVDGRTIILSLCGLFFGPISASIAMIMAFGYRYFVGGQGAAMGLLTIVSSALTGVVFYYYLKKSQKSITTSSLILMGIIVHAIMISLFVFLPTQHRFEVFKTIGFTLLIYPLATLFIGQIMRGQFENKELNKRLKEREEKYRLLVEEQSDLVIKIDANSVYQFVSQSYCNYFNKTEAELLGKTFLPLVHPDDLQASHLEMEKLKKPPYKSYFEQRAMTKYGWRWLGWSGKAILNDKNEIISIIGVGRDITEVIEAQNETLASREELSITLMSIGDGVITTDHKGIVTRMNTVAEKLTGFNFDNSKGKHLNEIFQIVDAETNLPMDCPVDKVLKYNRVIDLSNHTILLSNDGQKYHISDSAAPIIDKNGTTKGVILVFSDVSEKYQTQHDLDQERTLLRSVIDALPFSLYIKDIDGRKVLINKTEEKYIGKPLAEIIGKTDSELYESKYADSYLADDQKVISKGLKIVDRVEPVPLATGGVRWLSTTKIPWLDDKGKTLGLIGFGIDITERILAQEKIRKLSEGIEQSPNAIIITDRSGLIEYVNPHFVEMTGHSIENVMGKFPRILKPRVGNKAHLNTIWDDIKNHNKWKGEYLSKKKTNEKYWESITITPILKDGQITNLLLIIEDISERKKMIEDLTKAMLRAEESDKLKSAFLANMSHEIRTPMNGILGFSELLKDTSLNNDKREKYLEVIEQSGYRMLNIINDIIDISKIEAGEILLVNRNLHINELMQAQYNFFLSEINKKGLAFNMNLGLSDDDDLINSDKARLEQVITNLIKNALKFTNQGEIEIGYQRIDNIIRFYVRDTGVGIANELQEQVFERFRQGDLKLSRHYEGAGLGLSISKAFVEMMGGSLGVESKADLGSTFYFTIPLNQ